MSIELAYNQFYGEKELTENEFFKIQIAAEKSSPKALGKLLSTLSLDKKVRLVSFAFSHYREGSYPLLKELEQEQALKELIFGLKRNYFDKNLFATLLDQPLETILRDLNQNKEKETEKLFLLFNELTSLIDNLMTRLYKDAGKEILFHTEPYDQARFCEFVTLFGLLDYPPIFSLDATETGSLVQKLSLLSELFRKVPSMNSLKPEDVHQILSFINSIKRHLEATPEAYRKGLELFTCTMATAGKELCTSPTLETLLQGYQSLQALSHPIIVFDQSDPKIFAKNDRYIKELNRLYGSAIAHISKKEALQLAKELNIEKLIDTTGTGEFGFGGARNCQYLLTLILKHREKNAAVIFKEHVLEGKESLFLVDDDMQIPEASLYSAALLAHDIQNEYSSCTGFQYGRITKFRLRLWDLQALGEAPEKSALFPPWSNLPASTGISEYLTKPKICLNLPHGCEERHSWINAKLHYFLQPSYHLGGTRYPTKQIPTRYFVGLEEYLQGCLKHVLLIGMISNLVDPTDECGRCILPWNRARAFNSLKDELTMMASEETQKELAMRFLHNVREFFQLRQKRGNSYMLAIQQLLDMNLDFHFEMPLTAQEQASLDAITTLYKAYQQDATLFWQFGTALASIGKIEELHGAIERTKELIEKSSHHKLSHYPITNGFYLLACSVGKGNFCQIIRSIIN